MPAVLISAINFKKIFQRVSNSAGLAAHYIEAAGSRFASGVVYSGIQLSGVRRPAIVKTANGRLISCNML
ncbi:hypothetical protein [Rhizobium tropici]|uniref:Uncharacterized protein n=1 Tax=Rhizobium tropici TaxID=398 RepID=A0A329Y848_RHITR|nr:hypothetical protein [Rhizobium tropici]RAX40021.1 hypothetical protein DQ393_19415 [Rhizobium tropici]